MSTWNIGMDSWIIQDGNYPDFATGDECRFALEFSPKRLSRSVSKQVRAEHLAGGRHTFVGDVVFISDEAWVIDFGLRAYTEGHAPRSIELGMRVEGELYLGLDPFTYKDALCHLRGMPPLSHGFRIEGILLETTPWIAGYIGATRTLNRDESKESFVPVSKTDAWLDDDKNAHYVLQCMLLSSKPPNTPLQPTAEERGG
jgi:hypothetical protein